MEVYHESLPYPIFRYNITPFSTHTLSIHKNGVMTECEYPALAFSNQDSLVSTVGLEYGIKYGTPEIIDTSKLNKEDLDFANYRRKRQEKGKA